MIDSQEPLGVLVEDDDDYDIFGPDYICGISEKGEIINMHCDLSNYPFADMFLNNNEKLLTNPSQEPTLNRLNSSSILYDTLSNLENYDTSDPEFKIVSWLLKPIIEWEEKDVLLWATCISMKAKCDMFDSNVTRFSQYQLDGKYLYDMTRSKFIELLSNEEVANIFYYELQSLKNKQQWDNLSETSITSEVLITLKNVQISANREDVDMESNSMLKLLAGEDSSKDYISADSAIDSGEESNSDVESCRNDEDIKMNSYPFFTPLTDYDDLPLIPSVKCIKTEDGVQDGDKPQKKKVGRPPGSKKQPKESKIGKLWENLVEWLYDERCNPDIITWDNYEMGIFRFTDSGKAAKLWGEIKKNDQMTFEKMTRAMRYHYKNKVLVPVDKKLFYQFGEKAHGWRKTGVKPIIGQ